MFGGNRLGAEGWSDEGSFLNSPGKKKKDTPKYTIHHLNNNNNGVLCKNHKAALSSLL